MVVNKQINKVPNNRLYVWSAFFVEKVLLFFVKANKVKKIEKGYAIRRAPLKESLFPLSQKVMVDMLMHYLLIFGQRD